MKTKGWRKIFSFTFIQYVKTKSFIVGTIIICLITAALCVLTNILPNTMMKDSSAVAVDGDSEEGEFLSSGKLYLYDEVKILTDDDKQTFTELFKDRFSEPEKSLDDTVAELKGSESLAIAVQVTSIADNDGKVSGYEVKSYYAPEAKDSADTVNSIVSETINRRIMLNAGVSPDKYDDTKISVTTYKTEAGNKNLNPIQGMINYIIPLVTTLILFMLIFSYGSVVAQSIATEKTSRVMELLLTSVRPLAIVIGKVLAMGLVSFLQFFLIISVGAGSFALSAPFGWMGKAASLLKNPDVQAAVNQALQSTQLSGGTSQNIPAGVNSSDFEIAQTLNEFTKVFTLTNVLTVILIFVLGFLFFALIAALIGASVSRMEDLQAAMSPYSIIGVLGMYLAYFPVVSNTDSLASGDSSMNPVQLFSYFFPVSSPFALPSAVLLGTIEPWKIAAGIGVLAVFVVLIAIVVSKVYEAIILHNGNRIKFGDILKMAVRK